MCGIKKRQHNLYLQVAKRIKVTDCLENVQAATHTLLDLVLKTDTIFSFKEQEAQEDLVTYLFLPKWCLCFHYVLLSTEIEMHAFLLWNPFAFIGKPKLHIDSD